jgi:hemerythrin
MMLKWNDSLNTGIAEIDKQHKRIVRYINDLSLVRTRPNKMDDLNFIIKEMVDYTLSHFAFEEKMMEEAMFPGITAHKRIHEVFRGQIADFQSRLSRNEDVAREIHTTLIKWLTAHIMEEDMKYVDCIKANIEQPLFIEKEQKKGFFSRLFT